ncbi:MAG TPA: hypothetical protein IAC24_00655 [Candidatus Onthousia faecigallinarum]|nr:hypothetical protein [Candidatus Onthousia faecigallinarum]
MDEEMKRQKYRNLLNQLYQIQEQWEKVDQAYSENHKELKENFVIDDKMVEEDTWNQVRQESDEIEQELRQVMVRINNKI